MNTANYEIFVKAFVFCNTFLNINKYNNKHNHATSDNQQR